MQPAMKSFQPDFAGPSKDTAGALPLKEEK